MIGTVDRLKLDRGFGFIIAPGQPDTFFHRTALATGVFMEVAKYAKEIGMALNAVDTARAEKLHTAWLGLKATFKAIQFNVGSALAEPLSRLMGIAEGLGLRFGKWIRENEQVIVKI